MKYCLDCGEQIDADAELCPSCGVTQTTTLEGQRKDRAENEKYCFECGELINKKAEICPECGVRQYGGGSSASSDKIVAGILALLLGGIGAHKFYQGNIKYGVLYLCFFWTGIPALLGLIEGIIMLIADDLEYEQKYADGSIFGKL
ncbi:NINE protein [Natronorubrum sp. JWXQ-INN-674]|uniref:NINE protein n=1 Tax=Natronorubrum halalkaliphilum TaxID=2691917 RepID=A0A6B0VLJ8_9EURY|nr:TM2 domain-containing protein [Natronorubrum halalkaliphilum]MXV61642.1 NINE protein [Natronorubrum halalkaliphilum]